MYLGRVVGCVWATVKNANLTGQRLLLIQPLTPELLSTGKRLICLDAMGAGAGELIYYVRGKEASFPFLPAEPAAEAGERSALMAFVRSRDGRTAWDGSHSGLVRSPGKRLWG